MVLATAFATAALGAGGGVLTRLYGISLRVDAVEVVSWVLFGGLLAHWGGRISASLFEGSDVVPLLRQNAVFDWWSLIRF